MIKRIQGPFFVALLAATLLCFHGNSINGGGFTRCSSSTTIYDQNSYDAPKDSWYYPKVFLVPLPSEWNRELLDCRTQLARVQKLCGDEYYSEDCMSKVEVKPSWFILEEDAHNTTLRFQQTSPESPFGPIAKTTELHKTFQYTPLHPRNKEGEYEADVYFHNMVEGYVNRVSRPEEADLFYVPVYWRRRLECHPDITNYEQLDAKKDEVANLIADWINRFPPRNGLVGPNFFTVQGGVCSCPRDQFIESSICNPLQRRPDMEGKLRIGAWESPVTKDRSRENLLLP